LKTSYNALKKKGHFSHHFSPQYMHIENSDITPVTSQHYV